MRISVCIATYNGDQYIIEQLLSILNQLGPNDEIVISDDSSTDLTVFKIKSLNDKRINLIENQAFGSPIYNFENALKNASGDYVFLSDQDDLWHPDKVQDILRLLLDSDLVLHDCYITDNRLNYSDQSMFGRLNSKVGLWSNIMRNSYMGCCMAFKKEVLIKALPFPKSIPMHDQWIGLVGEMFFKVTFSNKKLIYYRRHSNNVSPTGLISSRKFSEKIKGRMQIISGLFLKMIYG
jgi:glycosyltransferase involved in cell wall biosynthesis